MGCAGSHGTGESRDRRWTASGAGDTLAFSRDDGAVTVDVRSSTGIGSARIELPAGARPRSLLIRLHLGGLEELRFEYDSTTVLLSLSGTDPPKVRRELHRPGAPIVPIADRESPHWMEVRRVAPPGEAFGAGAAAASSVIEVTAPAHFLQGEQRTCILRWIDFYR
jgi:hypothetical protein